MHLPQILDNPRIVCVNLIFVHGLRNPKELICISDNPRIKRASIQPGTPSIGLYMATKSSGFFGA